MHNYFLAANNPRQTILKLATWQIQKIRLLGFRLAVLPYNVTVSLAAGGILLTSGVFSSSEEKQRDPR